MEQEQEQPKDSVLVQYIKDRILRQNKNFIGIAVGATGSGKSLACLKLAEKVDPTFDVTRVCFTAKQFMDCINDLIADTELGKRSHKGAVILWDEFGVEHSAREFMSKSNRVINYFFQTCRAMNMCILLSVPILSFIDSNTRKLCHCVIEMRSINHHDNLSTAKVQMLQTNVRTGKEYNKHLRYRKIVNGVSRKYKLYKSKFGLPSKDLLEAYELKKKQFTKQLNKDISKEVTEKNEKEADGYKKPLSPKQEELIKLLLIGSIENASKELNISIQSIYETKNRIQKAGYTFVPIMENKKIVRWEIE